MRRPKKRAQAMVELAMLAPMIFMLLIFVFDLARAAATWAAISEAVREGSRTSVTIGQTTAATDYGIIGNTQMFGVNLSLNPVTGCVHGRSSGMVTPPPTTANTGYIYILSTVAGQPNAPSGGAGYAETVSAGCNAITAAGLGRYPIKVVIAYNYQPFTPFASQFMPGGITMIASSTMSTEF
jgi:Flp pilus assembly protein TadG